MAKRIKASTAVYGGSPVKTFAHDLSNYSRLRSSLSSSMRAKTLTLKELRQATPEQIDRYITELNIWKTRPQSEKAARAKSVTGMEKLFQQARKSPYFGDKMTADKMKLATAAIKLQSMPSDLVEWELGENLNALDRVHAGGYYRGESYYDAKYFIEEGTWDPAMASDDMLRCVISNDWMLSEQAQQDAITEYISRLGETDPDLQQTGYASERSKAYNDILAMAEILLR